ncbi:hypothetical protein ACWT_3107 [Actinoplanes sp. SE50]|uniref:CHAT domain-containing protein n=1 Tax=unclassified Actinoplanes TaxID=2626549 RepID=UPI00023EC454|nr:MULTISPECIES: CHAT domain-containing protein [unclassified Actinoplanes]AEV84130.1 hypothetical protein ACPL_3235 [Actinoplanes sp. SE50/110]ATO82522.1 hypothetical protein ACWT_3107 [Actinoplanes sp. SE50]SLL99929.1 CHAT domain-containing protein [Actinoplanes sp. SE50/110]
MGTPFYPDIPVIVRLEIPSRTGTAFAVDVRLACSVVDLGTHVRHGVTDPREALRRHLERIRFDPVAGEPDMVAVFTRIREHLAAVPPVLPGLSVTLLAVERSDPVRWQPGVVLTGPPPVGPRSSPAEAEIARRERVERLRREAAARAEPPSRALVGEAPAQVRAGAEVSLIVHVARAAPAGPRVRSAAMRSWPIPPAGSEVTLVTHPSAGLTPLGPIQQAVRVPPDADSDPVRFAFRAGVTDVHRIEVTAWAGGTFLARLVFEIAVSDRAVHPETATKSATTAGDVDGVPGAVTMQVHQSGNRYTFQLHNSEYVFDPVTVTVDTAVDGVLGRILETLRRFARSDDPPPIAREWLRNAGVSLWDSLVPEAVREQYLRLHGRIGSFAIATGNDVIPWELLYPMTRTHDAGFLVRQFPVTRTLFNTGRSRRINIGQARFVRDVKGPANAEAEFQAIGRILSPGRDPARISDLDDLLALLSGGEAGLTHFACHAGYRDDGPAIAMTGGDFSPMMLATVRAKEMLAPTRPLVFINACRSAGAVPYFTRMMGWAQQFLGAGAGAFVGTLWDVRSRTAQTFAEAFYSGLSEGKPLGQAALLARRTVEDDYDPTWLAYTIYGDADALAFPVSEGRQH